MKKLLLKLWYWIMKLTKGLDKAIDRLVPIASAVVEGVKKGIEHGSIDIVADVVTRLIPGEFDDVIIDNAIVLGRKYIPVIALQLNIVSNISVIEEPREQLIAVFAKLQHAEGEVWQKFCSQLAQQLLIDMADNKITWGEAGMYVELYYKTFVKE